MEVLSETEKCKPENSSSKKQTNVYKSTNKLSLDKMYKSSKLQKLIDDSKSEFLNEKENFHLQNINTNNSYSQQSGSNSQSSNNLNNSSFIPQMNINSMNQLLMSNSMNPMNSIFNNLLFLSYLLIQNNNNNFSMPKNNKNSYKITQKHNTIIPGIKQVETLKCTTTYIKTNTVDKSKINLDINSVIDGTIKDTTIRLIHIPKNFSSVHMSQYIDKILNITHEKCNRIYNYLRVPLSKKIGKNLGFCFINVIDPKYLVVFYKEFNGKILKNCKKQCIINLADIQIKDVNKIDLEKDASQNTLIFNDCDKAGEYFN